MKYKLLLLLMVVSNFSFSQNADEIVKNADDKFRGKSSYSEITININRPKWSKEMKMKG